jgi:preprotein translocase subunit Sec63
MNGLDTFYGIPQESQTMGFSVVWIIVAVLLAAFGAWIYVRIRKLKLRGERETPKEDYSSRTSSHQDAYTILGVRRGDTFDEIHRAYRKRMKEYHPDRVAGLGSELRELAERKAKEINMAFEELKSTYGAA